MYMEMVQSMATGGSIEQWSGPYLCRAVAARDVECEHIVGMAGGCSWIKTLRIPSSEFSRSQTSHRHPQAGSPMQIGADKNLWDCVSHDPGYYYFKNSPPSSEMVFAWRKAGDRKEAIGLPGDSGAGQGGEEVCHAPLLSSTFLWQGSNLKSYHTVLRMGSWLAELSTTSVLSFVIVIVRKNKTTGTTHK